MKLLFTYLGYYIKNTKWQKIGFIYVLITYKQWSKNLATAMHEYLTKYYCSISFFF